MEPGDEIEDAEHLTSGHLLDNDGDLLNVGDLMEENDFWNDGDLANQPSVGEVNSEAEVLQGRSREYGLILGRGLGMARGRLASYPKAAGQDQGSSPSTSVHVVAVTSSSPEEL